MAKKMSKEEEDALMETIQFSTLLEGMQASSQGFLVHVTEEGDDEAIADPIALKSPHSHIMKDIREERDDARELARLHNESEDESAGVKIEALDNMTEGEITKGVHPDFPDGIADPTLFRLEFRGKTSTISASPARSAGAMIAGIRKATSWMTGPGGGVCTDDLGRTVIGAALADPDSRTLVFEMSKTGEGKLAIAFEREKDAIAFIEGYEAAAALFADVAAVRKAA